MCKSSRESLELAQKKLNESFNKTVDANFLAAGIGNHINLVGVSMSRREEYLAFFEKVTKEMLETTKRKNADYTGKSDDPFANFKMVESLGIAKTEQGFLTRMTDKLMRITSFTQKGELQVRDESVTDTLQDLAVYCILFMAYLKLDKGQK